MSMRVLVLVCLVAVSAACSVSSGAGSSRGTPVGGSTQASSRVVSGPLARYTGSSIAFSYPAAWRYHEPGWVGSIAHNFMDLSAQPMGDPCHTHGNETDCGLPVRKLRPNGVIVVWVADLLHTPAYRPLPARRVTVSRPGSCRRVGGTETMSGHLVTRARVAFMVTACLRGPHLAANEAAVRAMVASAHTPSMQITQVVVPRVKPMYVKQAERALRAAGLRVVIASVPKIADVDAGVNGYAVRSQAPAAGARVPPGTPIVLRLAISFNGGPGGVGKLGVVPDLVGLPINRALSAATAVGLHVTVLPVAHRLSSDAVTKQSLTPGARVDTGEVITLHLG